MTAAGWCLTGSGIFPYGLLPTLLCACWSIVPCGWAQERTVYDHHVHVLSPELIRDWKAIGVPFSKADSHYMDPRTIEDVNPFRGAFLVSMAHLLTSSEFELPIPEGKERSQVEAERVRDENDFVARCVASAPTRLAGFFSVNPLRDYSRQEMERCWSLGFGGLKIHVPACEMDLRDPEHVQKLRETLAWASEHRIAVLIHLFTPEPEGDAKELARTFWREIVAGQKGLELYLAHLGSAGGFNATSQAVLTEFVLIRDRCEGEDTQSIYFDLSGAVLAEETEGVPGTTLEDGQRLVGLMREIGIEHFLPASDWPVFSLVDSISTWQQTLPLTDEEFRALLRSRSPVFSRIEKEVYIPSVDEKGETPVDAIVILGTDVNRFLGRDGKPNTWRKTADVLTSTPDGEHSNHISSELKFRDAEIHLEFRLPTDGPGNSGVYIHGSYELQIIHSTDREHPGMEDAGALYGFSPPLVNACLGPGKWQTYDILFRAPRRNETGEIIEAGTIFAWLNGRMIHNGTRFQEPKSKFRPFVYRTTPYVDQLAEEYDRSGQAPLFLQDHGDPVEFRKVWIRPVD